MEFVRNSFKKRLSTMLKVDFRRMFTMPLLYILVGTCLIMPNLILAMTTMMDGTVSIDPQTVAETVLAGFENAWQIIGYVSTSGSAEAAMAMDMASMCNINLLYFLVATLVCLFVGDDFRSGYAKNLFTVRSKKADYVFSKTLVCFVGGGLMILAFFAGTLAGGAFAGLPFAMEGFTTHNLIMCLIAKVLLMAVFVPIYLIMSVAAKHRSWLSMLLSLMVGMFLFMMIPMLSSLDATIMQVIACLAGGVLFSLGLGSVSNLILKKTSLV